MLLYMYLDGVRLVYVVYVVGFLLGCKVWVGDYECEFFMFVFYGGGGNFVYVVVFVMFGEIFLMMNVMNKDESWFIWLGLDDEFD